MVLPAIDAYMFWSFVTIFGDVAFWVGGAAAAYFVRVFLPKDERKHVSWLVIGIIPAAMVAFLLAYVLKDFFMVPRPCYGALGCPVEFAFPSGHATVIFAGVTTLLLFHRRRKLILPLYTLAVLVALSRIALGVHYYEDVIGGAALGMLIAIVIHSKKHWIEKMFPRLLT